MKVMMRKAVMKVLIQHQKRSRKPFKQYKKRVISPLIEKALCHSLCHP